MPIALTCPGCDARLSAPDSAAGKAVKCSQCAAVVPVPAADAGYEVVDAPRPVARAVAARPVRDGEEPRAARKPRVIDNDEDNDRPRKRRPRDEDDDEGDDDRPRRGNAKGKKRGGVPVWVFAAGGGGLLLVIGVGVAVLLFAGKGGPGGIFRSAPPGFTAVRDSEGGFQVYLPGQIRKAKLQNNGQTPPGFEMSSYGGGDGNAHAWTQAIRPGDNFNPGTSPDQLYGLLKPWAGGLEAPWNEIVSKTPITLDGKPALEVRVKEKKDWMTVPKETPLPSNLSPEVRQRFEEGRQRMRKSREADMAKPGRRDVYYVTTNGRRIIILHVETKGEFVGDDILKTVRESFEFI